MYEKDHAIPASSFDEFNGDFTGLVERMLPLDPGAYRILCKPCHVAKSTGENATRRAIRKDAARKKGLLPLRDAGHPRPQARLDSGLSPGNE